MYDPADESFGTILMYPDRGATSKLRDERLDAAAAAAIGAAAGVGNVNDLSTPVS